MNYADAIAQTMCQVMQHPKALLLGEGVADPKGVFGTCLRAHRDYPERVIETPISETMLTGALLGLAIEGWRPVYVHARYDFSLLGYEHLINTIAKRRFLHRKPCPITIRCVVGRGWGQGPNHSQSFHAHLAHVPGLRVFIPATAASYIQVMPGLIEQGEPLVVIEPRRLFDQSVDLGFPARHPAIWLISVGDTVLDCIEAKGVLEQAGISAQVIPWEEMPMSVGFCEMLASGRPTRPVVIADMGYETCGWGAEMKATLHELGYSKVARLGQRFSPSPMNDETGQYVVSSHIVAVACRLLGVKAPETQGQLQETFRGPF